MLLAFMFAVNIYGLESFSSVRNSCFRSPAPYFDLGGTKPSRKVSEVVAAELA